MTKSNPCVVEALPSAEPTARAHGPDRLPGGKVLRVADVLARRLTELGVQTAFGVVGGGIAPMADALNRSEIEVVHMRHETGAAFAAAEASLAGGRPAVVFTTTGPGITNALTGLCVARKEGAQVLFLSGATAGPMRGRRVLQESVPGAVVGGLYRSGPIFHYATLLDHGEQMGTVLARLARGVRRPHGFVAHIGMPTPVQSQELARPPRSPEVAELRTDRLVDPADVARVAALVRKGRVAIWVGFGARGASGPIRELAERLKSPVMTSPRGKGVLDEGHPLFVGVTGLGGHGEVRAAMERYRPEHVLVLGTRMGELTSGWDRALVPSESFIHVDIDPEVPGIVYPDVPTVAVQAELGAFLERLLDHVPAGERAGGGAVRSIPVAGLARPEALARRRLGPVRPQVLMAELQRVVVDGSRAMVLADVGNSLAWTINCLRFDRPGRFRANMEWAAMGHGAGGAVGAAKHHADKVVAVVGDGAMLMSCEVSTAVRYRLAVVWVVLNDSLYGMVEHGMRHAGYRPVETAIPETDFAALAGAMGACGIRVESEEALGGALQSAMAAPGPVVVDVVVDPDICAPVASRLDGLEAQGVISKEVER